MSQHSYFFSRLLCVFFLSAAACAPRTSQDDITVYHNKEEDYFKQLTIINEAVRKNIEQPIFYYKRAYFFWENNKLNQAKKDIETVLEMDDSQGDYHYLYARIAKDRGEYAEAAAAIERALQAGVQEVPFYELGVEVFYKNGQPAAAQRFVQLVEKFDIEVPSLNYWKALLALDRQDTVTAMPLLRKVLADTPTDQETWLILASYYEQQMMFEQAVEVLKEARQHVPPNANILHALARVTEQLHGLPEAFPIYELAATYPGTNFEINYSCVKHLIYNRRHLESIPYYEKALLQNPTFHFGHFQLGYIYEMYQKDLEAALSSYQKAFNLSGEAMHQESVVRVQRKLERAQEQERALNAVETR